MYLIIKYLLFVFNEHCSCHICIIEMHYTRLGRNMIEPVLPSSNLSKLPSRFSPLPT